MLYAFGLNHRTASLDIREKMNIPVSDYARLLKNLVHQPAVNEAVLLSTCNRTEVYAITQMPELIPRWLAQQYPVDFSILQKSQYLYHDYDAVKHLMRLATGLDSMVLGEPQILGQLKEAYQTACHAGSVGHQFKYLFPSVFSVTKHVRSNTEISANPISVAYVAIQLAKQIFSDIQKNKVLLVGMGETIQLVATHLRAQGVKQLIMANRSLEKARLMAHVFGAQAIRIGDIMEHLKDVDIVITATASQLPIIGKGLVESTMKKRKHKPLLMIDLAVPRDIEKEVGQLKDVYLYNVDDLQHIVQENLKSRVEAAKQAEAIIELEAMHYMQRLQLLHANTMIAAFRRRVEKVRDDALEKAYTQIQRGEDPKAILSYLAHSISNKMMHRPTMKIREALYDANVEQLEQLKDLLGLE